MANDLNTCIFIGRLTRDMELKYTNSGTAVGNMAIAVNKRVKRNEQWTDETYFFDMTVWGKTAENLSQYLKKGQQVRVSCEAKQDRWTDTASGNQRSKVGFVVSEIQLLGGKRDDGGQQSQQSAPQANDFDDSDIPF